LRADEQRRHRLPAHPAAEEDAEGRIDARPLLAIPVHPQPGVAEDGVRGRVDAQLQQADGPGAVDPRQLDPLAGIERPVPTGPARVRPWLRVLADARPVVAVPLFVGRRPFPGREGWIAVPLDDVVVERERRVRQDPASLLERHRDEGPVRVGNPRARADDGAGCQRRAEPRRLAVEQVILGGLDHRLAVRLDPHAPATQPPHVPHAARPQRVQHHAPLLARLEVVDRDRRPIGPPEGDVVDGERVVLVAAPLHVEEQPELAHALPGHLADVDGHRVPLAGPQIADGQLGGRAAAVDPDAVVDAPIGVGRPDPQG